MPRKPEIVTLKKRAAFLAVAASGRKWVAPGLILQARAHDAPDSDAKTAADASPIRFGLTASKKVGNAVKRNRARRRLRALAHETLPAHAALAHDYVLIARPATVTRPYADLRSDLETALRKLKAWK